LGFGKRTSARLRNDKLAVWATNQPISKTNLARNLVNGLMKKLIFVFLVLTIAAQAQDESRKTHYNLKKGIALEGYDPVSYFNGKPLEGSDDIKVVYKSVTYLFANATNAAKFKQTPDKYEPAYGGWCAFAMGDTGEKVKIDPETFKILNGKLYLFYNFWANNTLTDWNKNEAPLKSKGDQNWKKIVE
jgi:YHS domain-containing protein